MQFLLRNFAYLVPHFRTQYLVPLFETGVTTVCVRVDTLALAENIAGHRNRKNVVRVSSLFLLGFRLFSRRLPPLQKT